MAAEEFSHSLLFNDLRPLSHPLYTFFLLAVIFFHSLAQDLRLSTNNEARDHRVRRIWQELGMKAFIFLDV